MVELPPARIVYRRWVLWSLAAMVAATGCGTSAGAAHAGHTRSSTAPVSRTSLVPTSTTTTTAASGSGLPTLSAVSGKVIAIDPGHDGANAQHPTEINRKVNIGNGVKACNTTGTETNAGYPEATFNWDVALRTKALLDAAGATVVLTRPNNSGWGPCIDRRAAIANDAHADAAVSIHADGGPARGRGFHVIYPTPLPGLNAEIAEPSRELAVDLRDAYAAGTGMPFSTYTGSEGLDQRSDLGGLNLAKVPAVFIETGNMRNATDASLLTDPGWRQRAASAIAQGIATFLAQSPKPIDR